jgi:tetratricopeptide (TPR) repeat protein
MEICPYKQLHAYTWYFLAFSVPNSAQAAIALARALKLAREASEGPELGAEFCLYSDHDYCLSTNQWGYGAFLIDEGEVEQATALITDSLQRLRKRGDQPGIGECLAYLGILALLRGDIAEAHTLLQEVMTVSTTCGLPVARAIWQPLLGIVTLYGGHAAEARHLLKEGLRVCLEIKNVNYLAHACMCLAEMALWEDNADEAARWLEQSLAYQVETAPGRINIAELQRLFVAARLATMQEQYRRAATLLGFAEAAHRRIHYVYAGPMLPLVNAALTKVREALSVEVFDEAFASGQQLPLDEVYTTLLAPAHIRNIVTRLTPT